MSEQFLAVSGGAVVPIIMAFPKGGPPKELEKCLLPSCGAETKVLMNNQAIDPSPIDPSSTLIVIMVILFGLIISVGIAAMNGGNGST